MDLAFLPALPRRVAFSFLDRSKKSPGGDVLDERGSARSGRRTMGGRLRLRGRMAVLCFVGTARRTLRLLRERGHVHHVLDRRHRRAPRLESGPSMKPTALQNAAIDSGNLLRGEEVRPPERILATEYVHRELIAPKL